MKKSKKTKIKEEEIKTVDDQMIEKVEITPTEVITKMADNTMSNDAIGNTINEVIENAILGNVVTEVRPVEKNKTITAKVDRCFNNDIKNKFLTRDREYPILNSTDVSFTIVNDQGVQHCFLYADAGDLFYL